ncbi:MAG: quinoprotein relay system zinc metallohydrolase 2 [Gammaproteobacteria bacterium]|jgi:quinoprotein relay system zinc metallohydrolase 2
MKNYYHVTALTFYFALTLSSSTVFSSEINTEFNLTEIAQGDFVHTGVHVTLEDKQNDDIANIGFIVGESCVAVIDTGGSITIGNQLLQSIQTITDKPVCYVINTHVHFDHILGNKVFVSDKTKFVGHHQLAEAIEQNRSFFLENFKNNLSVTPSEASIIAPDMLIEKKTTLDLGNRELSLIPYIVSHSHTDLIVIDNKTGTLWAGDLIFRQRIPSLTGSLKGWIKVMDELMKLDVQKVVPGHGAIADSVEQALQQQHGYLHRLLKDTRKAVAEGQFMNDAMQSIDKENESNWLLHDYRNSGNVSKAFTELEWE